MAYIDVEHGYFTPAQSDLNWAQTFRMTNRAPGFANRIFDTLPHMESYINDTSQKASATPGLLLVVIKDEDRTGGNSKNNGLYRIKTVKELPSDPNGTYEKVGDVVINVSNFTTDLSTYSTSGIYFLKNTTDNSTWIFSVDIENNITTQYLFNAKEYRVRKYENNAWSNWASHTYATTDGYDTELSETSTNAVQNRILTMILNNKANKNGTYPELIAGGLVSRESDSVEDSRTSFIFRSSGGSQSISNGYAKLTELFGNVINGVPFSSTKFKSVGYNAFKPTNILDKTLNADGTIVPTTGSKIAYVRVLAGEVGTGKNNGYIISSQNETLLVNRVGFVSSNPLTATSATILTAVNVQGDRYAYIPPQDGWLLVDSYNLSSDNMCAHLAWSYTPNNYLEYTEDIIDLPEVHTWGMGKAGTVMDEVNLLDQVINKRVDRALLTDLTWVETINNGDNAFSDTALSTIVGEITASSSSQITVNSVIYDRYAEGDSGSAYAWKDQSDNIVYTSSETPASRNYVYTTSSLASTIKLSTENVYIYGLSSSYIISVSSTNLVISTGNTQIVPATEFADKYVYYELQTYVVTPISTEIIYEVSDFGTEEFLNTVVPPTYATFFYMQNLYDSIRQLIASNENKRSYSVDFGANSLIAQDVNVESAIKLNKVVVSNIATLKVSVSGTSYIQFPITLSNNQAAIQIPVPDGAIVTWEITRVNTGEIACLGVRYEY